MDLHTSQAPGDQPTKATLRRAYRLRRQQLELANRRQQEQAMASMLVSLQSPIIASYAAMPGECDLRLAHLRWWDSGKTLLFPLVVGPGRMQWYHCRSEADFKPGFQAILEPNPEYCPVASPDQLRDAVLLVPGVAYGPEGSRLGQGGGFYDRLLTATSNSIGVGYAEQWCEQIPEEEHDQRVSRVLLGGEWRLTGSASW